MKIDVNFKPMTFPNFLIADIKSANGNDVSFSVSEILDTDEKALAYWDSFREKFAQHVRDQKKRLEEQLFSGPNYR